MSKQCDLASATIGTRSEEQARLAQLEGLLIAVDTAIGAELDLAGAGGLPYAVARRRAKALERKLDELSADIMSKPVGTWGDVAVRARLAEYWQRRNPDGQYIEDQQHAERALVSAVCIMLGMQSMTPSPEPEHMAP